MVWTPIPRSMGRWIVDRFTGPLGDVLWFIFLTAIIVALVVFLIAVSPVFGAIIAGSIVSMLVSDQIREWLSDAYQRRFFRPW